MVGLSYPSPWALRVHARPAGTSARMHCDHRQTYHPATVSVWHTHIAARWHSTLTAGHWPPRCCTLRASISKSFTTHPMQWWSTQADRVVANCSIRCPSAWPYHRRKFCKARSLSMSCAVPRPTVSPCKMSCPHPFTQRHCNPIAGLAHCTAGPARSVARHARARQTARGRHRRCS